MSLDSHSDQDNIVKPRIPEDLRSDSVNQFGRWFVALAENPTPADQDETYMYAIFDVNRMPPARLIVEEPSKAYAMALVIGFAPSRDYAVQQICAVCGLPKRQDNWL